MAIEILSPLHPTKNIFPSGKAIKIKITQNTLNRCFTVEHKGKEYYVDYLNSDGQILGLSNRDYWEITDDEWYEIEDEKLISFCINHFNDYNPKLNV